MSVSFFHKASVDGVHIRLIERRLLHPERAVPLDEWPRRLAKAPMRTLRSLIDSGDAREDGDQLFLPHPVVAALPSGFASQLGLPPLGAFSLTMQFDGRIDSPDGRIRVRWSDANYRSHDVERTGAMMRIGKECGRLSDVLYRLAESIDHFNSTAGSAMEARIAAWAPIQRELATTTGQQIPADAYMKTLNFYQAGAFALDVFETPNGPDFVPILMSRSKIGSIEDDAPSSDIKQSEQVDEKPAALGDASVDALLPPELQRQFVERNFNASARTHDAYVLGRNAYVVLDKGLTTALDVVRAKRRATPEERKAFSRNPRAAVAEALAAAGLEATAPFIETAQYSERVERLGVWEDIKPEPRSGSIHWLPESFDGGESKAQVVDARNVDDICDAIERARSAGENTVTIDGKSFSIAEIDEQISKVRESSGDGVADVEPDAKAETGANARIGLIIKSNIDNIEYEIPRTPRDALIAPNFPHDLMRANKPKQHQIGGFDWLIDAWRTGWPGVLLADDMGLGKTYQALAFLAWIRANLTARGRRSPTAPPLGPLLVVAPTALLRNWLNEAAMHLTHAGLGEAVEAFGGELKKLKRPKNADWSEEDALDLDRLRNADWILTTYETLADYHRAFARVPYSVAVFDEIQKIKEPGSINARSAKTINADFVLGLTGTPIENKIEDLWAIFDRIAPGYLGALRDFSKHYGDHDPERLTALKAMLDQPGEDRPAPMLRRMKDKSRDGLPEKFVETYEAPMPKPQADAYRRLVENASDANGSKRQMLEILHRMRSVSLHPAGAEVDTSDPGAIDAWICASARTAKSVEILRRIEARGEKALVFVEDLDVQRAFAESVATIFDLPKIPSIINGSVPGSARQEIVDRFQKAPIGFDLLVLSPKAAGVGLTITAANHVVHLSRWWNPAVEDQCNDRAYRIGATRDVIIHIPLAIHPSFGQDSFDVKLDRLLERKRSLSRHMLCVPESGKDVEDLFRSVAAHA